jgi:LacI family transcriptional regulator
MNRTRPRLPRSATSPRRPPVEAATVCPRAELGAEAARMLLDCIDEPERPARSLLLPVTLPVTLTVRGSTAPAT